MSDSETKKTENSVSEKGNLISDTKIQPKTVNKKKRKNIFNWLKVYQNALLGLICILILTFFINRAFNGVNAVWDYIIREQISNCQFDSVRAEFDFKIGQRAVHERLEIRGNFKDIESAPTWNYMKQMLVDERRIPGDIKFKLADMDHKQNRLYYYLVQVE